MVSSVRSAVASYFLVSAMIDMINLWPNTALEPTAAAPWFYISPQIHACSYSRRGSALDR
jgi:hypothetical protein